MKHAARGRGKSTRRTKEGKLLRTNKACIDIYIRNTAFAVKTNDNVCSDDSRRENMAGWKVHKNKTILDQYGT
jgi:hypothetical protein